MNFKPILSICNQTELGYISELLVSYNPLTEDQRRASLLAASAHDTRARTHLIELMDQQIRYFGSSDFAYLVRSLFDGDGGVPASEVVSDVYAKLKLKQKVGGSVEGDLCRLVEQVVDKELLSKSPQQLGAELKRLGVGEADMRMIIDQLKRNGTATVLPILYKVIGPKHTLAIIQTIVVAILAQFLGREAAKHLVQELIRRNPWLAAALGPAVWVLSGTWLVVDLQGAAFRKTVPICLALGLVARQQRSADEAGLPPACPIKPVPSAA